MTDGRADICVHFAQLPVTLPSTDEGKNRKKQSCLVWSSKDMFVSGDRYLCVPCDDGSEKRVFRLFVDPNKNPAEA